MTGEHRDRGLGALGVPWWLQLYLPSDTDVAVEIVDQAKAAGASAIVISVDVPVLARRRNVPAGYPPGWNERLLSLRKGSADSLFILGSTPFTWPALAALRARSTLRPAGQGGPRPRRCPPGHRPRRGRHHRVHPWGAPTDCAPTAAEVLPAVVEAADGRCAILADGGIRRGSHVLRMMVRGADAVLIGRPALWGLAVGGAAGVRDAFGLLERELISAMGLTGCWSLGHIAANVEWQPGPITPARGE